MPAHKSLAEKRRIAQDLHDGKTHKACIEHVIVILVTMGSQRGMSI